MSATLVVHLGPHKTATSLIQQVLAAADTELVAHGVHYARLGRQLDGHHPLAFALWSPDRRANLLSVEREPPTWTALADEAGTLAAGDRLVVSSENLAHVRAGEIDAARAVRELGVELVVGVRDPATLLPSLWQEGVKWGRQWSFDEAVGSLLAEDRVQLLPLLDRWLDVTGAQRVHALVVPARVDDGSAVVTQLAAALDCPAPVLLGHLPPATVNPSLPWVQVEALRHVSATVDPEPSNGTLVERQRVLHRLLAIEPPDAPLGGTPRVPEALAGEVDALRVRIADGLVARGVEVHADLGTAWVGAPAESAPPAPPAPRADEVDAVLAWWQDRSHDDPTVSDAVAATRARLRRRPAAGRRRAAGLLGRLRRSSAR